MRNNKKSNVLGSLVSGLLEQTDRLKERGNGIVMSSALVVLAMRMGMNVMQIRGSSAVEPSAMMMQEMKDAVSRRTGERYLVG
jgi:hypothetical protein